MLYIALLRGINVGGNNIIRMADLKACFEEMGFSNVKTYIQSGNVLFESSEKNREKLIAGIEKTLSEKFSYKSRVVVITGEELAETVRNAPAGFGSAPEKYRYDVLFLKEPLTAEEAMKSIEPKEGVDQAHAGTHVLYFSRLISAATQSRLVKVITMPVYQFITIRNWNTTTKLLALAEV
jgi:uncharacterized protein (DUF1697 family)